MDEQERVTVREYIEALLGNCKEHCRDKFVDVYNTMGILVENQGDSIKTAKIEMDRRLEGMNEFRNQLEKQAGDFVNKAEQGIINNQILERLHKVEQQKSILDGKMVTVIAFICAVVSVLIVVGAEILRHTK